MQSLKSIRLPEVDNFSNKVLNKKKTDSTVIAEFFVRVKISYSSVCQLSYARNFRTATVVSDTHAYVYGFRMLLNVLSAKSTKYTKLKFNRVGAYENLCDYSISLMLWNRAITTFFSHPTAAKMVCTPSPIGPQSNIGCSTTNEKFQSPASKRSHKVIKQIHTFTSNTLIEQLLLVNVWICLMI